MLVGCYQCEVIPGDFEANLATVLKALRAAEAREVEILALPESLLTGYYEDGARARANSFALDSPQVARLLKETRGFDSAFMVGFNERRGEELYNTVLVAERGELLGTYSKAFPCYDYFTPGREFPVFERKGLKYGVIICADGAFIEPARILALKGARLIFAPHYNYLRPSWVVVHYQMVRQDHMARARENGVWFLRANTVGGDRDEGMGFSGVGYGDSYLLDPFGQMTAHAGWHTEGLMVGEVHLERRFFPEPAFESRLSGMRLLAPLAEALDPEQHEKPGA